eukprot:SAG22_NODE_4041_length_1412_cov_1.007616_2_plen_184_part_00
MLLCADIRCAAVVFVPASARPATAAPACDQCSVRLAREQCYHRHSAFATPAAGMRGRNLPCENLSGCLSAWLAVWLTWLTWLMSASCVSRYAALEHGADAGTQPRPPDGCPACRGDRGRAAAGVPAARTACGCGRRADTGPNEPGRSAPPESGRRLGQSLANVVSGPGQQPPAGKPGSKGHTI